MEKEAALAARTQAGDGRAAAVLIEAHRGVIKRIALRYRGLGLDDDDLMQWGRFGFFDGILRWRPGRGAKLTSFARHRVRFHVSRAVQNTGSPIRLTVHIHEQLVSAHRRGVELSPKLLRARQLLQVDSLDEPLFAGDPESPTRGDWVVDSAPAPDALVSSAEQIRCLADIIPEAIARLSPKERDIIRRRILVDDGDEETLQAIAYTHGMTREGVRHAELRALAKMRARLLELLGSEGAEALGAIEGGKRKRRVAARKDRKAA